MEERLCAYSRVVAHFPTAVKEVNDKVSGINIGFTRYISSYLGYTWTCSSNGEMVGFVLSLRRLLPKASQTHALYIPNG